MSRGTKLFLLAGCACVLVLDGPLMVAALAASWRGPYHEHGDATAARAVQLPAPRAPAARVELARR